MLRRQFLTVPSAAVAVVLAGSPAMGQVHDHTRATVAASRWSRPVQLSGHGAIGSPGGTHPLAFDKTAYATWVQNGVIHLSTSDDGGVAWDHATRVTAHNTALYPCSLELSGHVLHLVWPDTRNHGLAEPYYKRSSDGGKTWTKEVRLSPGTDLFRIGTAVSGPAIHVVWFNRHFLEKVPAGDQTWTWTWGEVYYCRSMDGGTTWERAIRLTQPDSTACRPVVAASGKFVHVAWLDNRDAKQKPGWDWEIYYKRSTDGGATWGPDVRMSHNEWHSRHPQIMTGGDRVCCVWEDGAIWNGKTSSGWSGDGALYAAVSNDNGQTWNPTQRITTVNTPNGRATHAKSFAAGSRLFVGWTDAVEGGLHKPIRAEAAYFTMSTDGGQTWSPAERLAAGLLGHWAVNAVAGDESRALALLSRGDTIHVSVRQSLTINPTPKPHSTD